MDTTNKTVMYQLTEDLKLLDDLEKDTRKGDTGIFISTRIPAKCRKEIYAAILPVVEKWQSRTARKISKLNFNK